MSLRSMRLLSPISCERPVLSRIGDILWSAVQRASAALVLILVMPLFAILYVLVKATSPGPFLFRQRRCGYLGRPFHIMKIRTMTVGSDKNAAFGQAAIRHQPRMMVGRMPAGGGWYSSSARCSSATGGAASVPRARTGISLYMAGHYAATGATCAHSQSAHAPISL